MMNNFKNVLWGIVLVIVGVIIGTNSFGLTNINIFFDGWWTLFIIIPCFIGLFADKDKTGSIIGLLVGVILLLSFNGIIDFDTIWKLLLPCIIVIIGLSLIFKNVFNTKVNEKIRKLNSSKKDNKGYFAAFSGQNIDLSNEEFTGTDINAVFGGVKLDLRNAKIDKDALINASGIFGGVTILVPEDVNVKVKSTSLFGGVDNKIKNDNTNSKTIYINATCLFGGVDIK